MAIPHFLDTPFRFYSTTMSPGTVSDIISAAASELLALGWSSQGGGLYSSPPDEYGVFFRVQFTAIDAQNLQLDVINSAGVLCSRRRMDIQASGSNRVWIYSGPNHLVIDSLKVGGASPTNTAVCAFLLDPYPEPSNAHTNVVYGHGYYDASKNATNTTVQHGSILDNGTRTEDVARVELGLTTDATARLYTPGGADMWQPVHVCARHGGSTRLLRAGALYQVIAVNAAYTDRSVGYQIEIDDDVFAVFFSIGGISSAYDRRWLVRRA